ncbi:MAG: HEPN domain-containing protein [Planctomycetota bacterium]
MTDEEIRFLRMAAESLRAAELLAGQGMFGFAASRAYYTMFYVAKALLLREGVERSRHAGVIGAFGEQFAKTGRLPEKFHEYLIDGEDVRKKADYVSLSQVTRAEGEAPIDRAGQFLQLARDEFGDFEVGRRDPSLPESEDIEDG